MSNYIMGIGEERWERMEEDERLDALEQALKPYLESGIDDCRYEDGMLILCVNAMFCDMVTLANWRWWQQNGKDYGVSTSGNKVTVDALDTWTMTYDQAYWLVDLCNRLPGYPIIDEQVYSDLEMEAFEEAFRDEFLEGGELAQEWQDIGIERMRELAWEYGCVESDHFYIDTVRLKDRVVNIREKEAS